MKKSNIRVATSWSIQVLLAIIFISVGLAKLSGVESMVRMFSSVGLGQWLRYFVGAAEFIAGCMMFFSAWAAVGAGIILFTMVAAILTHLFLIGGNATPAVLLGALSVLLMVLKRGEAEDREERTLRPAHSR